MAGATHRLPGREGAPSSEYRTLLVPYDFSAHARAALFTATDLARRLAADLHLVHVVHVPSVAYAHYAGATAPPPVQIDEVRESALEALRGVARGVEGLSGKVEAHVVAGGTVDAALCEASEQLGADLIVMGTHGRTGLAHVFLGSVAERTLRRAPCPVLGVRAPDSEEGAS